MIDRIAAEGPLVSGILLRLPFGIEKVRVCVRGGWRNQSSRTTRGIRVGLTGSRCDGVRVTTGFTARRQ
jgi:hypothetical protein